MYRSSVAFTYAQDLFAKGPDYANAHFPQRMADTDHYQLSEKELDRASLEFRRAGLKSQAIATCVKHIEYFPKSAGAHKDYGATLAEYGRKDEAIEEYKKVLDLDPNDAESKKELDTLTGN